MAAATKAPRCFSWYEAARNVLKTAPILRIAWEAGPLLLCLIACLRFIRSLSPVATLWIFKLIIDTIVNLTIRHQGTVEHLWRLVALECVVSIMTSISGRIVKVATTTVNDRFHNLLSCRIMKHATTLDLAAFEDPSFYDKLERARRRSTSGITCVLSVMNIYQDVLSLIWLSTGLVVFSAWLFIPLTVAVLPAFMGEIRFSRRAHSMGYGQTQKRRLLEYFRFLGTSAQSIKEIKVFGLEDYLVQSYRTRAKTLELETEALAVQSAISGECLNLVSVAGYYACYIVVLAKALAGVVSVGQFGFLIGTFSRSTAFIDRILSNLNGLNEDMLVVCDLAELFRMTPQITQLAAALPAPRPIRRGFEFQGVSFAYPGSDVFSIRDLNLHFGPTETIAIVGENGTGKTTIIKLLTRLYDPTCGRVLLDGRDLREYNLGDLRKEISVIFQDFVQYDFTVRDNVGFGDLSCREQQARLDTAATKSFAIDLIDQLPLRWDQILGRRFNGGVNLSGGEWQKLALARAYVREAQVMILDEPTATLDARAEYQLFQRFADSARGRMAVLVSHRFSTVRIADRILVLGNGVLEEEGTHDQLIQRHGKYAELFSMQAAGYR
jgi:ATP-binding cassette subfamily B protein